MKEHAAIAMTIINGIEVFSAIEASGEVGFRINCGMEVLTEGASEPE